MKKRKSAIACEVDKEDFSKILLSAKMAARLQASPVNRNPILLRIDYDAGHAIGSSRKQMNEEFADIFTFVFQQFGERNETTQIGEK